MHGSVEALYAPGPVGLHKDNIGTFGAQERHQVAVTWVHVIP